MRKADGFTLLEVMVAMAILAITLVAVFQSQSQSISMASESRFITTASLLAQSKMTEMEVAAPGDLNSGSGDFGDDYPGYSWRTSIDSTQLEAIKKIEVTVSNERMASNNTFTLILYRFVAP
ncbi:MAG: type II secretion system minor pseudopilin GspI [Deltaproteobacteria bacterium]|nr:type II secretion system minor pseudopilin GspI [Deltaproteobacteria bacterium]